MAWENDCGLRSGTFLAFVRSNVTHYTLEHFSKLCKIHFQKLSKLPKATRLVRLLRIAVLQLNTSPFYYRKIRRGKTETRSRVTRGIYFTYLLGWLGFLFLFPAFLSHSFFNQNNPLTYFSNVIL